MASRAARVLIVNGASGVGKTAVASIICSAEGFCWIHPDGELQVSGKTSEQIFVAILARLSRSDPSSATIVDCQICGSHARQLLSGRPDIELTNVLLTCAREERERRLRERSGDRHDLPRIEAWSRVLLEDAERERDPIIDTTRQSPARVASIVLEQLKVATRC